MSESAPTVARRIGWRKSTRSGDQGACIEVAFDGSDIAVRDSKDVTGPVLCFSPGAWSAFTAAPPRPRATPTLGMRG